MEYQSRRNRRGRERRSRQCIAAQSFVIPSSQKSWSLMDRFTNFFIMTSLIAIVYLMLDYHCTICNSKCDLTNITKNIDDIAVNISLIKESYYDLETKVVKFSHELPKIEGQIELLESIASTIGSGDVRTTQYDSTNKIEDTLPQYPHGDHLRNVTKKYLKRVELEED